MSKFCRPIAYLNGCLVELDYLIENDAGEGMRELHLAEKAEHESAIAVLEAAEKDRYVWPTIADYEKSFGQPVNKAFRIGWDMGRMKESHFETLVDLKEDSDG